MNKILAVSIMLILLNSCSKQNNSSNKAVVASQPTIKYDVYGTKFTMPNNCYFREDPQSSDSTEDQFYEFQRTDLPDCMALADATFKRKMKQPPEYFKDTLLSGCIHPKILGEQILCQQIYARYMSGYLQDKIYMTPIK